MSDDRRERIADLEERVQLLESHVRALHDRIDEADRVTVPQTWSAPVRAAPSWPAPQLPPPTPAEPPRIVVDSEAVLKWGGVALVVLAVGFAVSTAISRGWIGPELQLAGALALSSALIGTGVRLRPTRPGWTHALCSGGIVALFTTFASDLFLEQANDAVAFAATAVAAGVGGVVARLVDSQWASSATVVAAAVGWATIADGEPPVVASTVFVVLLAGAAIALAIERRWYTLRLITHAAALLGVLGLAERADRIGEQILMLGAASLVAASLVWVPSIGDLAEPAQQLEVQLSIGVAPWALGVVSLVLDLGSDTSVGWTALCIAAGTGAVALAVRSAIATPHFVSLVIGASIGVSIGLGLLLSTTTTWPALAIQGAGLVILARALDYEARVLVNAGIVLTLAVGFVLTAMVDAWSDDVAMVDDVAHLVIVVALAVAAWQTRHAPTQRVGSVAVLALVMIWLGSVLVHVPQGQAAVSVSWAMIGTTVLVAGAIRKRPDVGAVGLAVLGVTVGKLLTVDLREVDTLWRAGLFLLVGLALLRLGFLLPRLTGQRDEPSGSGRPPQATAASR